jgi:hypothetical protein
MTCFFIRVGLAVLGFLSALFFFSVLGMIRDFLFFTARGFLSDFSFFFLPILDGGSSSTEIF